MARMTRRRLLVTTPALGAVPWLLAARAYPSSATGSGPDGASMYPEFPAQRPDRVRDMVGVSHGNVERVRALLAESPALAKAAWDWGYGDWETALGAASHTGNREIARLLMEHGARPDMFTFAMLGHVDAVKAHITASPGIQRIAGPHGLTLMHHARQGGKDAEAVVAFLEQAGDADLGAKSQPLADAEKQMMAGQYTIGTGTDGKLDVTLTKTGTLMIKRSPDGAPRGLTHLGNNEFHPVGAPSVRIRFQIVDGRCVEVSVSDGPLVVRAPRSA